MSACLFNLPSSPTTRRGIVIELDDTVVDLLLDTPTANTAALVLAAGGMGDGPPVKSDSAGRARGLQGLSRKQETRHAVPAALSLPSYPQSQLVFSARTRGGHVLRPWEVQHRSGGIDDVLVRHILDDADADARGPHPAANPQRMPVAEPAPAARSGPAEP